MHTGRWICSFVLLLAAGSEAFAQSDESADGSVLLSAQVSQAVRAGLPKFQPRENRTEKQADSSPALKQPERKNRIIRLPEVVVHGERPPVFREQDIHTAKGLTDLAMKRYFSGFSQALNRYKFPLFGKTPEAYAMARWRAGERFRVLTEFREEIDLDIATGNEERAKLMRDVMNDTLLHKPLFLGPAHAPYRDARGQ